MARKDEQEVANKTTANKKHSPPVNAQLEDGTKNTSSTHSE